MSRDDSSVLTEFSSELFLHINHLFRHYFSNGRSKVTNIKRSMTSTNRLLGVHVFIVIDFLWENSSRTHHSFPKVVKSTFSGSVFYRRHLPQSTIFRTFLYIADWFNKQWIEQCAPIGILGLLRLPFSQILPLPIFSHVLPPSFLFLNIFSPFSFFVFLEECVVSVSYTHIIFKIVFWWEIYGSALVFTRTAGNNNSFDFSFFLTNGA